MKKISRQAYTTEFKELAVRRVRDGESVSTVVKELGLGDQTLRNWIKSAAEGKLKGTGTRVVTRGNGIIQTAFRSSPFEAGE